MLVFESLTVGQSGEKFAAFVVAELSFSFFTGARHWILFKAGLNKSISHSLILEGSN